MKDQQIYYSCGQKYQWRLRLFLWCYYHSFLWGDKNWLVNNWYFGHWNLWLWNHVHTVWPRLQHAQSQPLYIYMYITLIMHPNRKARVYCIHSFLGDNICAHGLQNQLMPIPTRQINWWEQQWDQRANQKHTSSSVEHEKIANNADCHWSLREKLQQSHVAVFV